MSKQADKKFVNTFLAIIGFLVLFTVVIIVAARMLEGEHELTPEQVARIEERITAPGKINSDHFPVSIHLQLNRTAENAPQGRTTPRT